MHPGPRRVLLPAAAAALLCTVCGEPIQARGRGNRSFNCAASPARWRNSKLENLRLAENMIFVFGLLLISYLSFPPRIPRRCA